MVKKASDKKLRKLHYASSDAPCMEFSDYVNLSIKKNKSVVLLTFGQLHPNREEVTVVSEIIMPFSICVGLKDNLIELLDSEE